MINLVYKNIILTKDREDYNVSDNDRIYRIPLETKDYRNNEFIGKCLKVSLEDEPDISLLRTVIVIETPTKTGIAVIIGEVKVLKRLKAEIIGMLNIPTITELLK